jgi:hypothetical protein
MTKTPPSDYKQRLRKVIDTSIDGQLIADHSLMPPQADNPHLASEMDASSLVAIAGEIKRKFQKVPVPVSRPLTSGKSKNMSKSHQPIS